MFVLAGSYTVDMWRFLSIDIHQSIHLLFQANIQSYFFTQASKSFILWKVWILDFQMEKNV